MTTRDESDKPSPDIGKVSTLILRLKGPHFDFHQAGSVIRDEIHEILLDSREDARREGRRRMTFEEAEAEACRRIITWYEEAAEHFALIEQSGLFSWFYGRRRAFIYAVLLAAKREGRNFPL